MKSNQMPDEEMIREFISTGNLNILGNLYSGYMHLVYGLCLKYLKDREEAMDAVMQIFEKIAAEIPRHKIHNFKNWLHVVARNYCLMQLRANRVKNENYKEWLTDQSVFMENTLNLHPIDDDENNMEEALKDCIERLKNEQKDCIRLFYYENRCYSEIAVMLRTNEMKVKSHLQNAKRNLKICLEEKHVGEEEK